MEVLTAGIAQLNVETSTILLEVINRDHLSLISALVDICHVSPKSLESSHFHFAFTNTWEDDLGYSEALKFISSQFSEKAFN